MRYDAHLKDFVSDDFKLEDHSNFKEQENNIAYNKMNAQLREINEDNIHALLTVDEGLYFLKTLCDPNAHHSWKDAIFSCVDPISPFSGNIVESLSIGRIIIEMKGFGITATEYIGKNGNAYIKLSGHSGTRRFLDASRYLMDNPKILDMGIGTKGIENGMIAGSRFCLIFSAGYRAVELLLKDEYGLTDFFVNLTIDAAKLAVSVGIGWWLKGIATGLMVSGSSVIMIAGGVFVVGLIVTAGLIWVDDYFKVSESLIKYMKSHKQQVKGPQHQYNADRFFNLWGRYSRG